MIVVYWKGRAVLKNQRYRITKETKETNPKLVKTTSYKKWLDSIGWAIKEVTLKRYKNLQSVMISSVLATQADHHNLVDVVCDALEKCGLVQNDRDAGIVMSMPCERHKRGKFDEIWLFIVPGEELG